MAKKKANQPPSEASAKQATPKRWKRNYYIIGYGHVSKDDVATKEQLEAHKKLSDPSNSLY